MPARGQAVKASESSPKSRSTSFLSNTTRPWPAMAALRPEGLPVGRPFPRPGELCSTGPFFVNQRSLSSL